jgi:hypothetical protein
MEICELGTGRRFFSDTGARCARAPNVNSDLGKGPRGLVQLLAHGPAAAPGKQILVIMIEKDMPFFPNNYQREK